MVFRGAPPTRQRHCATKYWPPTHHTDQVDIVPEDQAALQTRREFHQGLTSSMFISNGQALDYSREQI